jgi:hypothetical protein
MLVGTILDGFDEGLAVDNLEGTIVGNFEMGMIMIGSTFAAGETYPQMGGIKDILRFTVTS